MLFWRKIKRNIPIWNHFYYYRTVCAGKSFIRVDSLVRKSQHNKAGRLIYVCGTQSGILLWRSDRRSLSRRDE
jgi:hypothetical protein